MLPIVNPETTVDSDCPDKELSTQAIETKAEQGPEKTCKTASKPAEPVTVTEWLVLVATNLYQTSSSAVPTQPGMFCVSPAEPVTQEPLLIKVAAEQFSP